MTGSRRSMEEVLVLPRDRVPGGCDFTGVRPAEQGIVAALRRAVAAHGRYLDRPAGRGVARVEAADPVRRGARRRRCLPDGTDRCRRRPAAASQGEHRRGRPPQPGGRGRGPADALGCDGSGRRSWRPTGSPSSSLVGMLNDDSEPGRIGPPGRRLRGRGDGPAGAGPRGGQAERPDGAAVRGCGRVGSAGDLVAAGGRRAAGGAAGGLSGPVRILGRWSDCGEPWRSSPCCSARLPGAAGAARLATTSCASSCRA